MFPKPRRPHPSIKTTSSQSPCTVRALPSMPNFASGLNAAREETSGLSAKGPVTPSRTKALSRACLAQRVLPASTLPTDFVDDEVQTSRISKRTTRATQARGGSGVRQPSPPFTRCNGREIPGPSAPDKMEEKPLFTRQDSNLASSCITPRVLPVSSLPADVPDSDMEEYNVTRGTKQAIKADAGGQVWVLLCRVRKGRESLYRCTA